MSAKLTRVDLHMISDSSGETLLAVVKTVMRHFKDVCFIEYVWSLVRTKHQIDAIVGRIRRPAFVMYTIVGADLRDYLRAQCQEINVPCLSVLSRVIRELSAYLGVNAINDPEISAKLGEDYFMRMEAINFAIAHDDGQESENIDEADIVLVGASRTSKSPTSMYLAYRGYKVVNVPFVCNIKLPDALGRASAEGKLVVGLTINPKRLMEIRRNRMNGMMSEEGDYTEYSVIIREVMESRKVFANYGWPIIDVTYKSVEEIAATIVQHYLRRANSIRGEDPDIEHY